jgi:hypothetical protein
MYEHTSSLLVSCSPFAWVAICFCDMFDRKSISLQDGRGTLIQI